MAGQQKQILNHGETVYVYWRKAIYPAEYRGYDNFQRDESHLVYISAANGEEEVSEDQIFGDYRRAKRAYPRATDHVKGI
jgi:hypothetical protein